MSEDTDKLENLKKHIHFRYEELQQVAESVGTFCLQMAADPLKAADTIQTVDLGWGVRRRQLRTRVQETFERQRVVWLLDELQRLCELQKQLEKTLGVAPEPLPWQVKGLAAAN